MQGAISLLAATTCLPQSTALVKTYSGLFVLYRSLNVLQVHHDNALATVGGLIPWFYCTNATGKLIITKEILPKCSQINLVSLERKLNA